MRGRYAPDCCPEYLRPEGFARLKAGLASRIVPHSCTVRDSLQRSEERISRFVLLDHIDWMSAYRPEALVEEWNAIPARDDRVHTYAGFHIADARVIADELRTLWNLARVVELGAGTGRNAESFGARLVKLERRELVDLCAALLEQARERAKCLPNVVAIEADATRYRPAAPADCAYFSYSLAMIPDWRTAIDNAVAMLRPGGTLGAVDFHLPRDAGPLERRFRTLWFARSGMRPSAEHLRYLRARLDQDYLREWRAPLPYLFGVRAPVYLFVGRRRERAR